MSLLQQPLSLGSLELPHRVLMAPLTRCRASAGRVPNALMRDYYVQRASAGLILTEATAISPHAVGYPDTPGIWSAAQVAGWKLITEAVHAAGGRIIVQLWHVGRISHPHYLDGQLPVAPSAIAAEGHVSHLRPKQPYPVPRALTIDEIAATLEDYRRAAANAQAAGFDGVELHGANGYLPDQFLHASSNQRTDRYGGATENRARFLLEATDALLSVWKPGRVGVHLAPQGDLHPAGHADNEAVFLHLARELGQRRIAFLCARESRTPHSLGPRLKEAFGGPYIANQGYTRAEAEEAIAAGEADAVAWGKLFIANPDLPARFADGAELNEPVPETFYAPEGTDPRIGYVDYASLDAAQSV